MSQFRSKFPKRVDDAVREAAAQNKRPKDVLAGLRAGTLPGLEGRTVQIADRTFYRKLATARARLRAGVEDPEARRWSSAALRAALTRHRVEGSPEEIVEAIMELASLSLKEAMVGLAFPAENAASARERCPHGRSKLGAWAWTEAAKHDPADLAEAVDVIRDVRRQVRAKLAPELSPDDAGWSHERSILDALDDDKLESAGLAATNGTGPGSEFTPPPAAPPDRARKSAGD
jgi:hypothetical protein